MSNLHLEYTGSGAGKRYTIASKIKVVEAVKAGASMNSIMLQTGISVKTMQSWVTDYDSGLYSLENTNAIIRKPKSSLIVALAAAKKAVEEAQAKVSRIQEAMAILESEGINIT